MNRVRILAASGLFVVGCSQMEDPPKMSHFDLAHNPLPPADIASNTPADLSVPPLLDFTAPPSGDGGKTD